MNDLKLSSPTPQIKLGGGAKSSSATDHSKLQNLAFENSGHTGFQKQLTPEQLEAINSVGDIEAALDNIIAIQNRLIGGGTV